jgi:hypothetical protein
MNLAPVSTMSVPLVWALLLTNRQMKPVAALPFVPLTAPDVISQATRRWSSDP